MKIKSLTLKHFKTYKEVKINCSQDFNIIIGPNNIGKSTIIESILLWQACLNLFINDRKPSKLFVGTKDKYLSFKDLYFIRMTNDRDIFHSNFKVATIKLEIQIGEEVLNLGFNISKPETIKDAYFKINYRDSTASFKKLCEILGEKSILLQDFIFIYQTKPISQIIKEEPFYNQAQIIKKISLAKSYELIRNKILRTRDAENDRAYWFATLENKIEKILGKKFSIICLNNDFDKEEYVKFNIKEGNKKAVEISLLGSGFLQVIEIFSTLQFIKNRDNCINVVLIDEPDSHIHSDLQVNLLNEIQTEEKLQSFVITHNDRLIDTVLENGNVLFINEESKKIGIIEPTHKDDFSYIKNELAGKIQNLKKDKSIYILTEDENFDLIKNYLLINGVSESEIDIISYFGCSSIGSVLPIGKYIIEKINPSAKILIHRDSDYLTDEELDLIQEKVQNAGFSFLRTKGVDIENEFISAEHINHIYPIISLNKAQELITIATESSYDDSLDRLIKKRSNGQFGYKKAKELYDSDKPRYRYGKKTLGVLKSLIQKEIKDNPNILQHSAYIENTVIKKLIEAAEVASC
jgi:AAA15 family ATPase/GTPase